MPRGQEVFFTEYQGAFMGVVVDHDKHAITVSKLVDGKWVDGDMNALYDGYKLTTPKEADYPKLPGRN